MHLRQVTLVDLPEWFVLVLLAVAWYFWALVKRLLEWRRQSWPVVQGRVAATSVLTEMKKYTRRTPELCYSYEVNGEHYYGVHEIWEGDFDVYRPGSPILVHYKPSDPSVSRPDKKDLWNREHAADAAEERSFRQPRRSKTKPSA